MFKSVITFTVKGNGSSHSEACQLQPYLSEKQPVSLRGNNIGMEGKKTLCWSEGVQTESALTETHLVRTEKSIL